MLKILFFKKYKNSSTYIIMGFEVFKLGVGIGIIKGKYEGIFSMGLIAYCDIE